jgi:hypothetical protein
MKATIYPKFEASESSFMDGYRTVNTKNDHDFQR